MGRYVPAHPRSNMRSPLGFRLFHGMILAVILCFWAGVGFTVYTIATNPDGAGRFAGRVIGGAINGAQESR